MDIVDFWKRQVDLWNCENKCNFCWEFSAPLVSSQINIVQEENSCCVQVFLTDLTFKENIVRNQSGLITSHQCVDSFSLWCLKASPLGVNNYNEIKGHCIEESNWNEIFKPIKECLSCGNILDTCEILGKTNVNVDLTQGTMIYNYLDKAYSGWKINYTFTQII